MKFTVNTQPVASILRQVLAICVSIIGILSADGTIMGSLPKSVSAILVAFGPVVLAIEHFVGDPSTGIGQPLDQTTSTPKHAAGPPPFPPA